MPLSRCIFRWMATWIVSCLTVSASLAQTPGEPVTVPPTPGASIRAYARGFGEAGTPQYTAALRHAITLMANGLATADGGYDTTRSVGLPLPVATDSSAQTSLQIDNDARYRQQLDGSADAPVVALDLENCGNASGRIVGGTKIKNPQCFADVARVLKSEIASDASCSAVLIDPHTMVTSAHCVCKGPPQFAIFGLDTSSDLAPRFKVDKQIAHDGVNCPAVAKNDYASLVGRDIGILVLAKDVPPQIARPSVLPASGLTADLYKKSNKRLVVVGYGYTEDDPHNPEYVRDQKQKAFGITAILSPDCSGTRSGHSDAEFYGCAAGKEILAVDPHMVGPCPGDSGGGAFMLVDQAGVTGKVPALVGLNSRSILNSIHTCGDGAVYTSFTPEILAWISRTRTPDPAGQH